MTDVATSTFDESGEDLVANAKRDRDTKRGPWGRFALFIRQVLDELRKVVTPTRKELISYTLVVLVFVVIMMTLVTFADILFGWAMSWVFGDGSALFG